MLIDVASSKTKQVSELLANYLKDYGIQISSTSEKLIQFNSISNTYLSVFMILGGLAIIIGTIGIGIIFYRNMLDRSKEIAMLMALGFTRKDIFNLVFKFHLY